MRFRCNMPTCGKFPGGFEFTDNAGVCPKCGASNVPYIAPLVDIHFIYFDKAGQINSGLGRQKIACMPKRDYLATHRHDNFAATGEIEQVTCPSCKTTKVYQEQMAAIEQLINGLAEVSTKVTHSGDNLPVKEEVKPDPVEKVKESK